MSLRGLTWNYSNVIRLLIPRLVKEILKFCLTLRYIVKSGNNILQSCCFRL